MRPNPGHLLQDAAGKRVRVRLANGFRAEGWRAETARWSLQREPFDIAEYEVIS